MCNYENVIHGFSTSLTTTEASLMSNQSFIMKVLHDKKYKLFTTRTPEFLGLDRIHAVLCPSSSNKSMKDVIVGVLHSGVSPKSKNFDDTRYDSITNTWKEKCERGSNFTTSNCNNKLIGASYFQKDMGLIRVV
jgi:hypothetical protein